MPKIITTHTTVYKFSELAPKAQQKALDNNRDINSDHDWFDCTYEDAKIIATMLGFEIDRFYFTGFSSQGDGACLTGIWRANNAKHAYKKVKEHAPKDTTLHEIAASFDELHNAKDVDDLDTPAYAKITHKGNYYHEWSMDYDTTLSDDNEDMFRTITARFAKWLYKQLDAQYDYLTSDEAVKETLEANDYDFKENGTLYSA